jgi:hypothetical protein
LAPARGVKDRRMDAAVVTISVIAIAIVAFLALRAFR